MLFSVAGKYEQLRAEGEKEGIKKGKRSVLLRQLCVRFGEPPAPVATRVNLARACDLDRWLERILTAPTRVDHDRLTTMARDLLGMTVHPGQGGIDGQRGGRQRCLDRGQRVVGRLVHGLNIARGPRSHPCRPYSSSSSSPRSIFATSVLRCTPSTSAAFRSLPTRARTMAM